MIELRPIFCWRCLVAFLYAAFLIAAFDPQGVSAQSSNQYLSWAYRDGVSLVKEVVPLVPLVAIASGGLIVTGTQYDAQFLDQVQDGYHGAWARYLNITNELGGPGVALPLLATFGGSLLTRDQRLKDAAFTSLESWVYAGIITIGLKYLFGRYRPEEGEGASQFDPFSGHSSFPSGHTTAAFAIITPWVLYYPSPLTYGLFALSTGTAIARIARDKHWPSDVIMGALIGFTTAKWLVKRHQGLPAQSGVSFSSQFVGNGMQLALTW